MANIFAKLNGDLHLSAPNMGTAPTPCILEIIMQENQEGLEVEHRETGEKVIIDTTLNDGDIIRVDSNLLTAEINGEDAREHLAFASESFILTPGSNMLTIDAETIAEVTFRERWL